MKSLVEILDTSKAPQTEDVLSCPICESTESELMFRCVDRMNHLPGLFANVRCGNCGLVRLSPRPTAENLAFYYPDDDYYSYSQVSSLPEGSGSLKEEIRNSVIATFGYPVRAKSVLIRLFSPIVNHVFLKRATFGFDKRFPRYVPNGNALDVGCGSGVFLSVLKRYGWNVQGVEFKEVAAKAARENHGIDVFVGNLEDAKFEDDSFDFVSFHHSLEHVADINGMLAEVKRILKPDGVLYIEVPNVESLSQWISGEYWLHWDAPRHLYSFSPSTLKNLLVGDGFVDIKIGTFQADFYRYDLAYKREDKVGRQLLASTKLPILDRIWAVLLKCVTSVYYQIDKGSGDFIACFAHKER